MPSEKNQQRIIMAICIIFLIVIIGFALYLIYNIQINKGEGNIFVVDVIDGDTFQMSDGTRVRLLCVDTPETDEEGNERARKFLESLILYKTVRLKEAENLDKVDKYERELRFVYVNNLDTEVFVNKEIVRLGFGELYEYKDETGECKEKLK